MCRLPEGWNLPPLDRMTIVVASKVLCLPFFLASAMIFIVGCMALRRREARGAWYLALVCLSAAVWGATEGMLYLGQDVATNMRITQIQYLGIAPLPPLALLFSLTIFGYSSRMTSAARLFLLVVAAAIILAVWTNNQHRLVFTDWYAIVSGPLTMLGLKHGPLWYLILGYHYCLIAILSLVLLRQAIGSAGFHRAQATVILAAVMVVWFFNAIYVTGNSPIPNMDISAIAFILVAGAMAWGFFRYSLLDIMPIAKAEVLRGLKDAVVVLDAKDRVVDLNPAAVDLFAVDASDAIGKAFGQVARNRPRLAENLATAPPTDFSIVVAGRERIYDVSRSYLRGKKGQRLGHVLIIRDITDRRRAEDARLRHEKLRSVLETAGAVCHELNQPLMVISGLCELHMMRQRDRRELDRSIETIKTHVDRMGKITYKLMNITSCQTRPYSCDNIIDLDSAAENTESAG